MSNTQQTQPQPQTPAMVAPTAPRVSPLKAFNNFVTSQHTQEYLRKVLGEEKNSFVNNIVSLVGNNAQLQKCEPLSVMHAALKATALKLPLDSNLGFAYVIPYGNNAQFQLGWRGFVQLALRTNLYRTINVREVRVGELIDEDFVSGEMTFKSLPFAEREQMPIIGYLAYFELLNGFRKQSFWSVEKIRQHGETFSKTFGQRGSNWTTNFDAMAKKTVLKLLLGKYGPMSVDLQNGIKADQEVYTAQGEATYADNTTEVVIPTQTEADAEQATADDAAKVMAAAQQVETNAK